MARLLDEQAGRWFVGCSIWVAFGLRMRGLNGLASARGFSSSAPKSQSRCDRCFGSAIRRFVIGPAAERFGEVFGRDESIFRVMRVFVAAAVSEILHETGGRIAQMHRYRQRTLSLEIRDGCT